MYDTVETLLQRPIIYRETLLQRLTIYKMPQSAYL